MYTREARQQGTRKGLRHIGRVPLSYFSPKRRFKDVKTCLS